MVSSGMVRLFLTVLAMLLVVSTAEAQKPKKHKKPKEGVTPFASCTGSSPTWTSTADSGSVQTCINKASNGDTINVSGVATWTTTVTLSRKYLTLDGGGVTGCGGNPCTQITMNETASPGIGQLAITATTTGNTFVTGFYFIGSGTASQPPLNISTTLSPLTKPPRIHHNTFDDGSPATNGIVLRHFGTGPCLIDHNTFNIHIGAEETIHNWGAGAGDNTQWKTDVVPGGPNMLFIEDNIFNAIKVTADVKAIEQFYGSRTVLRYNQFNNGVTIDAHAGARWWEVYQNSYNLPGTQPGETYHLSAYARLRGGSGVYYSNHSSGVPYQAQYPGVSVGPACPGSSDTCSGTWPVTWQVGRGLKKTYSPAYIWGNDNVIQNGIPGLGGGIGASPNQTLVILGTAPTDATNCSRHPGNVCDVVNAGATQPTLQRCQQATDVCPQSFTYAPYTYPHPLQGNVPVTSAQYTNGRRYDAW
jgi:hypothetical protein